MPKYETPEQNRLRILRFRLSFYDSDTLREYYTQYIRETRIELKELEDLIASRKEANNE